MQLIVSRLLPKEHAKEGAFFSMNFDRTSRVANTTPRGWVGAGWGGPHPCCSVRKFNFASVAAVTYASNRLLCSC